MPRFNYTFYWTRRLVTACAEARPVKLNPSQIAWRFAQTCTRLWNCQQLNRATVGFDFLNQLQQPKERQRVPLSSRSGARPRASPVRWSKPVYSITATHTALNEWPTVVCLTQVRVRADGWPREPCLTGNRCVSSIARGKHYWRTSVGCHNTAPPIHQTRGLCPPTSPRLPSLRARGSPPGSPTCGDGPLNLSNAVGTVHAGSGDKDKHARTGRKRDPFHSGGLSVGDRRRQVTSGRQVTSCCHPSVISHTHNIHTLLHVLETETLQPGDQN